jgi:hypothetical protein
MTGRGKSGAATGPQYRRPGQPGRPDLADR